MTDGGTRRGTVHTIRRDAFAMGAGVYQAKSRDEHCLALANSVRRPVAVRLEFARVE